MLSYQHDYHAGNHADILKHWILWECLDYLKKKPAPFTFIDTHAGSGVYDLTSAMAQKTEEYRGGIERLDEFPDQMRPFADSLRPWHQDGQYPGSSMIAAVALREGDSLWAFELHPRAYPALKENLLRARRHSTHAAREDGHSGLLRLLPTQDRRALILIDPSYEIKTEYQQVMDTLTEGWKKMPNATFALWYPVLRRASVDAMEREVEKRRIAKVQLFELCIAADADGRGMTGSGMIVVNPPWTLGETARSALPPLARALSSRGIPYWRVRELSAL